MPRTRQPKTEEEIEADPPEAATCIVHDVDCCLQPGSPTLPVCCQSDPNADASSDAHMHCCHAENLEQPASTDEQRVYGENTCTEQADLPVASYPLRQARPWWTRSSPRAGELCRRSLHELLHNTRVVLLLGSLASTSKFGCVAAWAQALGWCVASQRSTPQSVQALLLAHMAALCVACYTHFVGVAWIAAAQLGHLTYACARTGHVSAVDAVLITNATSCCWQPSFIHVAVALIGTLHATRDVWSQEHSHAD